MNAWMDVFKSVRVHGLIYEYKDGWMNTWMDECMHGWMELWMDKIG